MEKMIIEKEDIEAMEKIKGMKSNELRYIERSKGDIIVRKIPNKQFREFIFYYVK